MKNVTQPQISIPKPCHEDWDKMTPMQQGNFCGSCQKIVYDFTKMSEEEIIHFFEKKKGENICGRMKAKDVFTPQKFLSPQKKFWQRVSRLSFFAYALYMISGGKLFASTRTVHGGMYMPNVPIQTFVPPDTIKQVTTEKMLMGDTTFTPADLGQVEVISPVKDVNGFIQSDRQTMKGEMILTVPENILVESTSEICIVGQQSQQNSSIENPIRESDWKIFPNPIDKNLNVQWNEEIKILKIDITDMTGKLMKTISAENITSNQISIDVEYFPAGTYLLYLREENQFREKKFIVVK